MDRPRFVRSVDGEVVPPNNALWFLFVHDRLVLVNSAGALRLPDTATLAKLNEHPDHATLLGYVDTTPCFAGDLPAADLPPSLQLVDLRQAYGLLAEHEYAIAGYAAQVVYWDRTSRFCPVCATPTERLHGERAKRCPACHFVQYPRISPAIIVLVHRDGQVLLARKAEWPRHRYSLIAGFVEPGEALETCVQREVAEEVGISVDQIQYLGSQPWPFPHQLMVGFLARYQGGNLTIDTGELEDAAWFDLDALPDLPPPQSIARRILEWYLLRQKNPSAVFPLDPYAL